MLFYLACRQEKFSFARIYKMCTLKSNDKGRLYKYMEQHTHVLEDGTVVTHSHDEHHHGHTHSHAHTKMVLNRMSRLIGHLESIKGMVESGRDCSEVLIQLSAVKSAINGVSKIILKDHMEHCIVDAVRDNDKEAIDQLNKAIDQFFK